MPAFNDERLVVWSKCKCGTSFTSFRGHKGIVAAENCLMIAHEIRCRVILFDSTRKNRVAAFIFAEGAAVPHGLESVGGWPCPVLELADSDFALTGKRKGPCRFQSLRPRACPNCMRSSLDTLKWRTARIAFHRWKRNCRFIYS